MDYGASQHTEHEVEEPLHVDYVHLEELNRALEVERELVVKAHENYRNLKKKFIELKEENHSLQNDLDTEAFKILIIQKLSAQNHHMESLERERDKLVTENDELREEISRLEEELKVKKKEMKLKEEQMKNSFSDQIEELLEHTTTKEADIFAEEKEEFRRAHLLNHDDRVHELLDEIRRVQAARDEEVESLRDELNRERQMRIELATTAQSELNRRLKENMEKEVEFMTKEENFRKTLLLRTTSFERKVDEFQKIVAEKDELIAGMRRDLESMQNSEVAESSLQNKLEPDATEKNPFSQPDQKDEANQTLIEDLKRERNSLEITVAELKSDTHLKFFWLNIFPVSDLLHFRKKLDISPETVQEVKRLEKLLKEKEEELSSMRRQYRQLMRKVEHSLVHLEKQHMKTKRKLEENIMK
ncbi:hypothetical protein ANCDUO_07514 [Ancylostoma duodenale]|uniref:Uncharacterized protein n=1 Tax=Ancylostoma duodenale TaxID=51022 RepID=A0A0C2GT85_9BILA|nr:hypothetical protein ANCDUO_07514 [Ancylostoma duodenale]